MLVPDFHSSKSGSTSAYDALIKVVDATHPECPECIKAKAAILRRLNAYRQGICLAEDE